MKKSERAKILTVLTLIAIVVAAIGIATVAISADAAVDETVAIVQEFAEYQIGEKYLLKDDGYIGIPVEFTVYFDKAAFGTAKTGYHGTNVAIYFVNTKAERVGTASNEQIISGLLRDGFAVVTADYKNHIKAVSPALDWSANEIRKSVTSGEIFTDKTVFPSGTYQDTYVVPSGCSVTPFYKFWSVDEHGADGSLERIVETWNNDFKATKGGTVVEWVREEIDAYGNTVYVKKATTTAFDGSEPQWYSDSAAKNPVPADSTDAKYIKLKHTLAETITDCTDKNGNPIDLDLDMHIVYPVEPESPVPVMMLSGSSGYLTTAQSGTNARPHHNGYPSAVMPA